MPTRATMKIPKPNSESEFELMVLDALIVKWKNSTLTFNGRKGQNQNGVDIYGTDENGKLVGVQCKKYDDGITKKNVEEEIKKAETFRPKLGSYFIATSAETDARLQEEVRKISDARVKKNRFPINVLFWNDLIQPLLTDEVRFKKHYRELALPINEKPKRLISILEMVYYGVNVNHYAYVIHGEFGFMAGEDPKSMEVIIAEIENAALRVLDDSTFSKLSALLKEYSDYVIPHVTTGANLSFYWKVANDIGTRIQRLILTTDHFMHGDELVVFNLAIKLAAWDKFEFNKEAETHVSQDLLDSIRKLTEKLNGSLLPERMDNLLKEYESNINDVSASIAYYVYSSVRKILSDKELFS